MKYIATFYTHLSSLITKKKLEMLGVDAKQMPTPRAIRSSCGVAVCYTSDNPMISELDKDYEAVYQIDNGDYILINKNE